MDKNFEEVKRILEDNIPCKVNYWKRKPKPELILECCGKPESQCRCDEQEPDKRALLLTDEELTYAVRGEWNASYLRVAELQLAKDQRLIARQIFEEIEKHIELDYWMRPVIVIGTIYAGKRKWLDWWQALKAECLGKK